MNRTSQEFCAVILFALTVSGQFVPLCAAEKEHDPLELEISFWESRVGRDPADPMTPEKLGQAYLQKSRESGDLTYLTKAVASLEDSIKIKPKNPSAMNWLALAFIQQHRFKEALALAEKSVKLLPEDGFAYGLLGDANLELGDMDKAEAGYVRAMELAPEMFSLARWANLQFMRGDIPAALKFYKEACLDAKTHGRTPFNAAWCALQLGQTYFRIGKFDEAEAQYQIALNTLPGNYMPLDYLAELRGAQERYDESIALYEKALAIAHRPELCQALGYVLFIAQKSEQSAELHKQAVELYLEAVNQGHALYYHHLAGFYCDSKKSPPDAVRWARRDLDLRKSVYAHDCLAWALYQNGDFKEARDEMKKALSAGTLDAHLFNHASLIYFRAGDVAGSRDALRKAAELNPQYNKFHAHRY